MKRIIIFCSVLALAGTLNSCSKKDSAQNTAPAAPKAPTANDVASTASASAPTTGKFKTKSGIVHSTMNGVMGMVTEVTTYFDNYGALEARETTGEMSIMKGHTVKIHNLNFTKDGWIYSLDLEKKTGVRRKGAEIMGEMDYSNLSSKMGEKYHVKKEANQTVAGKDCEVYSMDDGKSMKGTVSSWQGIPMSVDMMVSGMPVKQKVDKIETDVPVPADKFEVPAGITIKDM